MNQDLRDAAGEYLLRYGGDVFPNLFCKARGSVVYDDTGREILDFTSGQMCATLGHNHPEVVKAVTKAGENAYHFFSGMIPEVVAQLARKVANDWMPAGLTKSLFINTGAESNEAALRIAKMYTGGFEVLAAGGSWHGVTGGTSPVSFASDRKGYGVPPPGIFLFPEPHSYRPYIKGMSAEESALQCLEISLKMFDMASTGQRAAIIMEPVISAGGVLVPPKSFMQALRRAADERDMLLIFDEAQTAFGRIGYKTAAEMFGVTPDVMAVSKTLGGGLPLAATVTRPDIEEDIFGKGFSFYTSHVSDPLPACIGLAVLKVLEEEQLVERSRVMGAYLRKAMLEMQDRYEQIGDVRGEGMLLGVELVKSRETKEPALDLGAVTTAKCFQKGLSMNIKRRAERGSVWRIAPPLTITHAEIDRGVAILDESLKEALDEMTKRSFSK
ncbi:MAG: aspartate aminotransferase family protein [Burkholderiaceae bacterium]|nr:aspartate aminotransferase family protein [Burkholderiaceae bacterium]